MFSHGHDNNTHTSSHSSPLDHASGEVQHDAASYQFGPESHHAGYHQSQEYGNVSEQSRDGTAYNSQYANPNDHSFNNASGMIAYVPHVQSQENGSYGVHPSYYTTSPRNLHSDSSAAPSVTSAPSRPPSSSASVASAIIAGGLPSRHAIAPLNTSSGNKIAPPGSSGSGDGRSGSGSTGSGSTAGSVTSGDSGHTAAAAHYLYLKNDQKHQMPTSMPSEMHMPDQQQISPSTLQQQQAPSLFDVPAGYRTTRSASDKLQSSTTSTTSNSTVVHPSSNLTSGTQHSFTGSSSLAPPLNTGPGPNVSGSGNNDTSFIDSSGSRVVHARHLSSSSISSLASSSATDLSPSLTTPQLPYLQQTQQHQQEFQHHAHSSLQYPQSQSYHADSQMPHTPQMPFRMDTIAPSSLSNSSTLYYADSTHQHAPYVQPQTPSSSHQEFKQPLQASQNQHSPYLQSHQIPFNSQSGLEAPTSPSQQALASSFQLPQTPSRRPPHLQTGLTPGFADLQTLSPTSAHSPSTSGSLSRPPSSTGLTWVVSPTRKSRPTRRQYHQSQDMTQQTQSQSHERSEANFVIPAPPSSAPAGITTFDLPIDTQQQFDPRGLTYNKLEPQDPFKYRGSMSTPAPTPSTNPSSASHSRSASVSSASYSSLGPLSASTSSSASSSIGDHSSTTSTPRRTIRLSNLDRKRMCYYAEANPRVKHEHIGMMFGVERSTVSKILKQKTKWFSVQEDNSLPVSPTTDKKPREPKPINRNKIGRHPFMEEKLMAWGKEQTENGQILTDEIVREKALEIAGVLNIELAHFKASAGWLENFKERSGYRNGRFSPLAPSFMSEDGDAQDDEKEEEDDYDETIVETASNTEVDGADPDRQGTATTTQPPHTSSAIEGAGNATGKFAVNSDDVSDTHLALQPASHRRPPIGVRGHRRGALSSMSSSTVSLPGLAEEDENRESEFERSATSSSVDILSAASSFSDPSQPHAVRHDSLTQPQHMTLHSTEPSPLPSPSCSTGSDYGQSAAQRPPEQFRASVQSSTPTQLAMHNPSPQQQHEEHAYRNDSLASSSTRLQQAGLSFNLSMNTMVAGPSFQASFGQQPQFQPLAPGPGFHLAPAVLESHDYGNMRDASGRNGVFSSRYRNYSAPNVSEQSYAPTMQTAVPDQRHERLALPTGPPYYQGSVQYATAMQYKTPLHRSHTDPIPSQFAPSVQDAHAYSQEHQGDETLTRSQGGADAMDVDGVAPQLYGQYFVDADRDQTSHMQQDQMGPYQQQQAAQQLQSQANSMFGQHARRATISNVEAPSFSRNLGNTSSATGHGHSHSMSAVTMPIYANFDVSGTAGSSGNEKTTLQEAYLSLQKVVDFLHVDVPSDQPGLAAPAQITALESLLAQMKQAQLSQRPALTPPSST